MPDSESYKLLTYRIAQLMLLIQEEKKRNEYLTDRENPNHEKKVKNLQELLDTNLRTFAILFNRNFDTKLDYNPEMQ